MHETHITENILKYLEQEEDSAQRRIKKICVRFRSSGDKSQGIF